MSWGIAVKQHGKKKVNERGRAWRGRDRGVGEEGRRDPGREGTRRRGRGEGSVGGKTRERDMEKMQQETPNKGHEEGGGAGGGGRGGAPAAKNAPWAGGHLERARMSRIAAIGRRHVRPSRQEVKQRRAAGNQSRAKPLLPQWRRYLLSINPHSGDDIDRQ